MTTRRSFLAGLGAGAAACALAPFANAAPKRRPNLVFILADDLGWMDTGVYGSTFYETPNIDALAGRGMRFTQAYAANPLCSPTRASILTGQYPGRVRFTTPAGHLKQEVLDPIVPEKAAPGVRVVMPQTRTRLPNEEYVTYAEIMQEVGYRTAFMGKWHLGRDPYLPDNQGFEVVVGGREHPGPPGGFFSPWPCATLPKVPKGSHICDVVTDKALEFIRQSKEKPFLLNLWYYDVHAPFQGKEKLIEKYRKKADPKNPQHCPTMGAMIEVMDQNIGRVMATLDELKLGDDTIVVFFSDNGGNMYNKVDDTTPTNNHPLRGGKANIYEGGTREPCMVIWPGVTKAGSVSDQLLSSVDWYPTIMEMLGLKAKPGTILDGVSMVPAFRGKPFDRGPIFCHFPHSPKIPESVGPSTYVHRGDWKLIRIWHDNPDGSHRYLLYDLAKDIGEQNNLAKQQPELVRELDALITQHLVDTKALCPKLNPAYRPALAGWNASKQAELSLADGVLTVKSTGGDPYFHTDQVPPVAGKLVCRLRMKSDSKGGAALYWGTDVRGEGHFHRSRLIPWQPQHDGEWHEYEVAFAGKEKGKLKSFRLDPSTGKGTLDFAWIRLLDEQGKLVKEWDFAKLDKGK
ncbi:MAG: sulfatase [Victivallales bacterium]|nr:sulfatase [Victivallales bacterium]